MVDKTKYALKQYDCGYCKYIFRQYVRKSEGVNNIYGTSKNNTSSQVVCPKCKAFLKTWDDGSLIEEVESIKRVSNRYSKAV